MSSRPGPWLQLAAVTGVVGALLAVVSGALGLGHEYVSALAVPPLAAVFVAAWSTYRQLLVPATLALSLFGAAAALTGSGLHVALAYCALAAAAVSAPTLSADGLPFIVSFKMHASLFAPSDQSTFSPSGDQKLANGVAHSYTPTVVYVGVNEPV